ncbi:MAG: two-component system histidine kinase, partial [Frankiales bacterium]|nr:two-component system histidine kinase [Frankiales bacterium]
VRIVLDPTAPLMAPGDPARIRQAVDNVLSNAMRYAPPGSCIRISAEVAEGRTRVEVTDEGPGFSAELLPVAFERFRREDKVRTRSAAEASHAGSGLGLAIVRTVLRSHGGDAQVFNRVDQTGARVLLSWPAPPSSQLATPSELVTVEPPARNPRR